MFAGTGNGNDIEQLEVVKAHNVEQGCGGTLFDRLTDPLIKLLLRQAQSGFNIFDTLFGKGIIPTFGNEGDLIFQIVHAIVDRRCRQHQHLGFHS